jgi:hypothetical protein
MDNPHEQNKNEYRDLLRTLVISGGIAKLDPRQHGLILAHMQQMIAFGLVTRPHSDDPFSFEITERGREYLPPKA